MGGLFTFNRNSRVHIKRVTHFCSCAVKRHYYLKRSRSPKLKYWYTLTPMSS